MRRMITIVGLLLLLAGCGSRQARPVAEPRTAAQNLPPTATIAPPTPTSTSTPTPSPTPRPSPTATRKPPASPASPTTGNAQPLVYDPAGRCRIALPTAFDESSSDKGYFPAVDRHGFVGLDSYDLGTGQTSFEQATKSGITTIRSLIDDYGETRVVNGQGTLRVDFEGGAEDLNGRGTIYFKQFGTTVCQVTFYVHLIAKIPYDSTFDSINASLQAVDPTEPRPTPARPTSTPPGSPTLSTPPIP